MVHITVLSNCIRFFIIWSYDRIEFSCKFLNYLVISVYFFNFNAVKVAVYWATKIYLHRNKMSSVKTLRRKRIPWIWRLGMIFSNSNDGKYCWFLKILLSFYLDFYRMASCSLASDFYLNLLTYCTVPKCFRLM